jgi:hypothetical protein
MTCRAFISIVNLSTYFCPHVWYFLSLLPLHMWVLFSEILSQSYISPLCSPHIDSPMP